MIFPSRGRAAAVSFALAAVLLLAGCSKVQPKKDYMWVAAPQSQVFLRDRLATLYNKTATLHTGDQVEVLERQKRFLRVRTASGQEGWIEARYLVGPEVYDGFQKLSAAAAKLPVQGHAVARNLLNMHLTPSRDGDVLYQLKEAERMEVFKRAVSERVQPGGARAAPPPPAAKSAKKKRGTPAPTSESGAVLEDWWLVRDQQGHAGWVLGRAIDLDVPLEIAQYAEGQRIVACFPLNEVQDADKKVAQYLTLVTEPHDGEPYDFDQVRVFTWNVKRHRYETAYRERLFGQLPAEVGTREFEREGTLPVFTIHAKDPAGALVERTYKLQSTVVRRVLAPGEQPPASAPAARRARRHRR